MQRVRFLEIYIVSWLRISRVDMIPFRASWTYILIGSNPVSGKQFRPTCFLSYVLSNFIRIDHIALLSIPATIFVR